MPASAAFDLTGDLPCASCGYNLRGLSIMHECPECGVPVRATLLARVDPKATELRRITRPRLVAAGLVCWSVGGLVALLVTWVMRLQDAVAAFGGGGFGRPFDAVPLGLAALVLSGLGALALVRPHAGIPARKTWSAILAVALYVPLAYLYWLVLARLDQGTVPYFATPTTPHPEEMVRTMARLATALVLGLIILGMRPMARVLVARSAVLRRRAVDRQTLYASLASLGITMLGDLASLIEHALHGPVLDAFSDIDVFLIGLGSVLLTVAVFGVVADSIRLVPVVMHRPLGLADILTEPARSPDGERAA